MDSLLTTFLLLLSALTAIVSYMFLPRLPVAILTMVAAIGLAIGVWYHWTQFSIDYRLSTWQEMLRNYASYVMVFLAILITYGVYAFTQGGGKIEDLPETMASSVRNAASTVGIPTNIGSTLFSREEESEEEEEEEEETPGLLSQLNLLGSAPAAAPKPFVAPPLPVPAPAPAAAGPAPPF